MLQGEVFYLLGKGIEKALRDEESNIPLEKWLLDFEKRSVIDSLGDEAESNKIIQDILEYFRFHDTNNLKKYLYSAVFFE